MDVTLSFNQTVPTLGKLADLGLNCFPLYSTAYSASEALAEHIVSAAAYGRNAEAFIVSTLKAVYTAPTGWVGNETLNAAIMVLRVIASVPDNRQRERIGLIMQCNERPAPRVENGVGLLVASRAFFGARQGHSYPNDLSYAYDRYVAILKELLALQGVFVWMTENRPLWTWMERDLLDTAPHHPGTSHGQARADYNGRREGDVPGIPVDHHAHSDSEGMPEINDSEEEDDEDSRFEEMDTYGHGPTKVVVEGAGNPAVNGVYVRDGFFERASKFAKKGEYAGQPCVFSLFQCNVSNNTKHWYISIVPTGGVPGTSADTDFYSAPVTNTSNEFPPLSGWTKSNEGQDPSPILVFKDVTIADDPQTDGVPPSNWDGNNGVPPPNGHQSYV
jgi:ubiquitin carboxyl-terminal hydrolase 9/24